MGSAVELFGRNSGRDSVSADHVAVSQLEQPGERVSELVRMLHEAPRNLFVGRVQAQGRSVVSMVGGCFLLGRAHRE